jgi:hypothetical protein
MFEYLMGRSLKGQGSQKTCLNRVLVTFADWGERQDLADKKGTSPDRFISVRGFFLPRAEGKASNRNNMRGKRCPAVRVCFLPARGKGGLL